MNVLLLKVTMMSPVFAFTGFWAAILVCLSGAAQAELREYPAAPASGQRTLTVFSPMELRVAEPLIAAFQAQTPGVSLHYHHLSTREIHAGYLAAAADAGSVMPDLLLSSAMDTQMQLANDGHAAIYRSAQAQALPAWARWRNEAFAYSFEPIVMVYNKRALPPGQVPVNRFDLLEHLQAEPELFRGRIGTYDPVVSGAGYMILTQDSEHTPVFWDLVQAFGKLQLQTFPHASQALDLVATGELVMAYGLPGSYAQSWAQQHADLEVLLLEDYTMVFSRIAIIPKQAPNPDLAQTFLDFLLSVDGQQIMAGPSRLYAIHPGIEGEYTYSALSRDYAGRLRPIRLGPGLLVYQDALKRRHFLDRWRRLATPSPEAP